MFGITCVEISYYLHYARLLQSLLDCYYQLIACFYVENINICNNTMLFFSH